MGGKWRTESHIKLLYCLHFITLFTVALCFVYAYLISTKTCQYQELINKPTPSVNSFISEDLDDDLSAKNSNPDIIISQERTKRNPILTDNPSAAAHNGFYQYNLKELLELENKKPTTNGPKRKRLKLRIMFNESDNGRYQQENPLNSIVSNPAIVPLPSEYESRTPMDNEPWVMIPIYSRIQMNYLKDFCFSLHDFCGDSSSVQEMQIPQENFSETSTTTGAATVDQQRPFESPEKNMSTSDSDNESDLSKMNIVNESDTDHLPFNKSLLDVVQINATYTGSQSTNDKVISTTVAMVSDKDHFNDYDEQPDRNKNSIGEKLSTDSPRKRKRCFVDQIGKPIEIGYRKMFYGAWMRDARPKFERDEDKRWVMEHFSGIYLMEYSHEDDLYKPEESPVKIYKLPHMFEGTSHVMFHGSLYYQRALSPVIVRYDIYRNYTKEVTMHGTCYRGASHLYANNSENYFDLAVDENGLWVMYRYEGNTHLSVARLHPKTLKILRIWNLTEIDTHSIGNSWITCGVVYMVKSAKTQNSSLYFAYDLYKQQYARLDNVEWTNVYSNANMIAYNPKDRKIYVYDNGHLIIVPLLLNFDVE